MDRYHVVATLLMCSLLFACAGIQSAGSDNQKDGVRIKSNRLGQISTIEWRLVKMTLDNKSIPLVVNSQVTFTVSDNNRVSGSASINRYSGGFKLDGENNFVWNKAFIMTRMAGPPDLMQQERQYMQVLMKTSEMYRQASRLMLTSPERSTILEFEKNSNSH